MHMRETPRMEEDISTAQCRPVLGHWAWGAAHCRPSFGALGKGFCLMPPKQLGIGQRALGMSRMNTGSRKQAMEPSTDERDIFLRLLGAGEPLADQVA